MEKPARRANHGKEDLRQRRSKQRLSAALLELMEETPFREISVVDICNRAMVHRTTFYAHFEDKNDLFGYVFQSLREEYMGNWEAAECGKDSVEHLLEKFQRILDFCKQHRIINLCNLRQGDRELQMMHSVLTRDLYEYGLKNDPAGEAVAQFYAGGVLAMMRWWLEQGQPISEQALTKALRRILEGVSSFRPEER